MKHLFKFSIILPIGTNGFRVKAVLLIGLFWVNLFSINGWAQENERLKTLFKAKKYKQIISVYRPNYRDLGIKDLILLSAAYERSQNLDGQVLILEQILKLKPKYYKAHLQLADTSKDLAYQKIKKGLEYEAYEKNLNDMMEHYRIAKKINPKSIHSYRGLMQVFKDQENVQEGVELAKEMIEVFGKTPETVYNSCFWMSRFGLVNQSRAACKQASAMNPSVSKPAILYAQTYKDSGDIEKYESEIFRLLKKFPNDPEVLEKAGLIFYENKDYFSAEQTLKKNENNDFELATIYYGFSLFQNQKYDLALDSFKNECHNMYDNKKEMVRFYEVGLRKLENHSDDSLWFKFQRAVNHCKSQLAQDKKVKIRPGHFERGIRLPANARYLEGNTVKEKRKAYEEKRAKKNLKTPKAKNMLSGSQSK